MKRDLIIVIVGRILQMAVLLLALRVMTTRLSTVEVGNFSLLTSLSTLFVWIFVSPVGLYVNRHTLDWWKEGSIWKNYGRHGIYIIGIAIFTVIALYTWQIVFRQQWAQQFRWFGVSIALYSIFSVFNQTVIPSLNIFGRRISYTICFAVTQVLCLGFAWFFTNYHALGEYWFFGQTIGFALSFLLTLPLFLAISAPHPSSPAPATDLYAGVRDVSHFCVPIAITAGLTWLQFQSYRIVIGHSVSLEFLGLFFAGYSASAGIMGAVEVTAGQFFAPYFYKHVQEADPSQRYRAWADYMSTLYPIMIVIVMVIAALSEPTAHLLLDHKFWSGSSFVAVGAIVEGVRVMSSTYSLATHVSKRTRTLLVPNSVGAACIVVTLIGGTWLFGERAVAPAMILSAVVFLATMHFAMVRHSQASLSLYGGRWVIAVAALLVGLLLLKAYLPPYGATDIAFLGAGALIILAAFLLILRDAHPVLSRYAH